MKHSAVAALIILPLLYLQACHCSRNQTELSQNGNGTQVVHSIARKLKDAWNWIKEQSRSEDTFIGRCAGGFKKLRMVFNFIIFKLGVIVTTLAFLSVLAFKTLGVGVLILIISSIGLFFKLKSKDGGGHSGHGVVHLHLHNKGGVNGGGGYYYEDYPWQDRIDNVYPKNPIERAAVDDLYKRIGLLEMRDVENEGNKEKHFNLSTRENF